MDKRSTTRTPYIDTLKGLAMLGVIMVHMNNSIPAPNSILSKVAAIGARCPQLFFIISAYLTWRSLSLHGLDVKTFWKKRFLKIAPLFYLALFVALFLPTLHFTSIRDLLAHIFFLNGLYPVWTNSIMGVEWYIADLALFYLLVPLLWKVIKDLRSALIILGGSVVISVFFTVITNRLVDMSVPAYEMYFHTFCIINQLPVLLMGIVAFYLVEQMKQGGTLKVLVGTGLAVAVVCLAFILLHLNKRVMTSSMIAGLAFTFLFLISSQLKLTRGGYLLQATGRHSFGMYCFHQTVINCFLVLVSSITSVPIWIGSYAAVALLSYLIGYAAEWITGRLKKG